MAREIFGLLSTIPGFNAFTHCAKLILYYILGKQSVPGIAMNEIRNSGIRLVVASFGMLCGLTGIIAGFFEVLQGNIAVESLVISTIGLNYNMADDFTYFAITIIPNFLVTGILAIIVSSSVIIWSVKYVEGKYGTMILFVLCIIQMLVGGGWVIDLSIMMCILSIGIGRPLDWWRSHLPKGLSTRFAKIFPLSLAGYAALAFSMLVLTIVGVNDAALINSLSPLALIMFLPILLMIFGGISHDMQRRPESNLG
jgi:hypothetical protein